MKRRAFITLLGGASVAWPIVARAQQAGRVYRIGLVFTTSPVAEMAGPDPIHPLARTFVQTLRTLGYLQGQNLVLEARSAEGQFERFSEIIRELVSLKVDAIVTVANPMTQAAKDLTGTIPIVMAYSVSPVEQGIVQSLNRPGGNVTGLAMNVGSEIPGKQLQVLCFRRFRGWRFYTPRSRKQRVCKTARLLRNTSASRCCPLSIPQRTIRMPSP
jgi:putative ABC transport system substrate-binding protein